MAPSPRRMAVLCVGMAVLAFSSIFQSSEKVTKGLLIQKSCLKSLKMGSSTKNRLPMRPPALQRMKAMAKMRPADEVEEKMTSEEFKLPEGFELPEGIEDWDEINDGMGFFEEPEDVEFDELPDFNNVEVFDGPKPESGELSNVVVEADLVDLGATLHIAESIAGEGNGLFLSLGAGVSMTVLPSWSILCGYAIGSLEQQARGDKSVKFAFTDPTTAVLWKGKPTKLEDIFEEVSEGGTKEVKFLGHQVEKSDSDWKIRLSHSPLVFVPDEVEEEELTWQTLGQFCNDLGLPADSLETYEKNREENALQLVYNIKLVDGELQPVQIVCVIARDLRIENKSPQEIGLTYGWNYWQETKKQKMSA